MFSATQLTKAIISCWVTSSISATRSMSKLALTLMSSMASCGILPSLAQASHTATSTCSQADMRASSVQMAAMRGVE